MKLRRNMLGLSQEKLGDALGLTFQQVQKYERGTNRIGASRLLETARILDVPVAFFFDDVDPVRAPPIPRGFEEPTDVDRESDPLQREETVELVMAYYSIPDERVRKRLFDLAKALWEESTHSTPAISSDRGTERRQSARVSPDTSGRTR